ncbi:MAG: ATP-binding protein [Candidatus Peribacteraceae bacterium]|jgi:PAS domain S-box-containing protein
MTLAKKILVPFGILIAIWGTLSLYLLFQFADRQRELSRYTDTFLEIHDVNHELANRGRHLETDLLSYALTGDAHMLPSIRSAEAAERVLLEQLSTLTLAGRGKELTEEYIRSRDKVRDMRVQAVEAIRLGDKAAAGFTLDKWMILTRASQAKSEDVNKYHSILLGQHVENGQRLMQRAMEVSTFFAALCILLLLIFSFYLRSSLIRPLAELTRQVRKVTEGDLHIFPAGSLGTDEIGQLTSSFTEMTAKLRHTYRSLEEKAERSAGELAVSQEQFTRAFRDSSLGMCLLTPEGALLEVNAALARMMGYAERDAAQVRPLDIIHAEDQPFIQEQKRAMISGLHDAIQVEVRLLHKRGYAFWALANASLVRDTQGVPLYFIVQVQDIHRRKVEEMAQSEFVALASHQLRTPLTSVRWTLGRALRTLRGKVDDGDMRLLEEARRATVNLAGIIDAMLTISQIEAGKVTVRMEDVCVRDLIQALREEFSGPCKEKRLGVRVDIPPTLTLCTDRRLLRECVSNLFSNAIKYTPPGGSISFEAGEKGSDVRITVSDTGLGIPMHQQERVFSKFFRGDNVVMHEPNGTGLGLYLVATVVRLLRGKATFRSREGEGTVFSILLPKEWRDH